MIFGVCGVDLISWPYPNPVWCFEDIFSPRTDELPISIENEHSGIRTPIEHIDTILGITSDSGGKS